MRAKQIAVWTLRGLLATVFIAAAAMKLTGMPRMVQEFGLVGFGQWFRIFTGALEIGGAVLFLVPRTRIWGGLVLLGICVCAFAAQIGPLHGDVVHVFVLGGLVALTLSIDLRSLWTKT